MTKVAIVGFGNIGKAVYEAAKQSGDMSVEAIVSSQDIKDLPLVRNIDELKDIDVAIICTPSRQAPDTAASLLSRGICTVDSYDIHSSIFEVRCRLFEIAKQNNCSAIIAAGWDPGSDSIVRALLKAMMPKGLTYTNFGPGMSMGHSTAVKAMEGVKDALSMTIPMGTGIHRRDVYVAIEDGADFEVVSDTIKKDDYFVHDETHVTKVDDISVLKDMGHGVNLTRKGVSGQTNNQRAEFNMSIDNPALTGQILVAAARAVKKQSPGCYTLIELPPINLIEGDTEELIRHLV